MHGRTRRWRRLRLRLGGLASDAVEVVGLVAVHAQEVLLNVVGAVELLLAQIAVEGLLVPMDVLVAREQVASVRGVGAGAARVSFAVARDRARASACLRARLLAAARVAAAAAR